MAELGQSSDPKSLVPGDPLEIRKSAVHLLRYGHALNEVADGLKGLDSSHWKGAAADAFREKFEAEPTRWQNCGDAFLDAEAAIQAYCQQLSRAQDQAAEAINLWNQGQQATQAAQQQETPPTDDPGEALRRQAQDLLNRARQGVDETAWRVVGILDRAQALAPQKSPFGPMSVTVPEQYRTEFDGFNYVIIDSKRNPETAQHVYEATHGMSWRGDQVVGGDPQPVELTIDRPGADDRRAQSMKQVPETQQGLDRDEYPPAMFEEGGAGSSVKYLHNSDNRRAGRSVQQQTAGLADGEEVIMVVN
ncbi:putative T7SS-secreted protein [Amycolatopsis tucumanensis]|uniref:WXG100 family type VII secretion target n=1 Tax=Amycolatopsis tucumanensis TaxID=401106 RepID=A0ABP7HII2_9PSEU|nr:NucA/NucB deoxyribonuclease domain-containing protein [Amycolatopsis tucumanensis]